MICFCTSHCHGFAPFSVYQRRKLFFLIFLQWGCRLKFYVIEQTNPSCVNFFGLKQIFQLFLPHLTNNHHWLPIPWTRRHQISRMTDFSCFLWFHSLAKKPPLLKRFHLSSLVLCCESLYHRRQTVPASEEYMAVCSSHARNSWLNFTQFSGAPFFNIEDDLL